MNINTINIEHLKLEMDMKYIHKQAHPTLPIAIFNYSPKCQYEKHWTDVSLQCRGLVLDNDYNVVARPFKKFFNYEEVLGNIPTDESYEIFDKMDGSMIIVFRYKGGIIVASRGSFTSEQALKAKELLFTKYHDFVNEIKDGYSYIFEIIY